MKILPAASMYVRRGAADNRGMPAMLHKETLVQLSEGSHQIDRLFEGEVS